jgi:hypothetical protein
MKPTEIYSHFGVPSGSEQCPLVPPASPLRLLTGLTVAWGVVLSLAMAVLVLTERGHAEQNVLINFWRKLKEAAKSPQGEEAEQALVVAVQFLAYLAPTAGETQRFEHFASVLDALYDWLAMGLARCGPTGLVKRRFSPALQWGFLFATTLACRIHATFGANVTAAQSVRFLDLLSALVTAGVARELDAAPLRVALWALTAFCPLRPSPVALISPRSMGTEPALENDPQTRLGLGYVLPLDVTAAAAGVFQACVDKALDALGKLVPLAWSANAQVVYHTSTPYHLLMMRGKMPGSA